MSNPFAVYLVPVVPCGYYNISTKKGKGFPENLCDFHTFNIIFAESYLLISLYILYTGPLCGFQNNPCPAFSTFPFHEMGLGYMRKKQFSMSHFYRFFPLENDVRDIYAHYLSPMSRFFLKSGTYNSRICIYIPNHHFSS